MNISELSSLGSDTPEAEASGELASKLLTDPDAAASLDDAIAGGLDLHDPRGRAGMGGRPAPRTHPGDLSGLVAPARVR